MSMPVSTRIGPIAAATPASVNASFLLSSSHKAIASAVLMTQSSASFTVGNMILPNSAIASWMLSIAVDHLPSTVCDIFSIIPAN